MQIEVILLLMALVIALVISLLPSKLLLKLAIPLLKSTGPIPNHVAFIMDGNRRFARSNSLPTISGHVSGFTTLQHTLEWSLSLGISTITIFAFSVENYKRPKDEVDGLMELARTKLVEFTKEESFIRKRGICVRVLGEIDLLEPGLREAAQNVMRDTAHHTK
jgi:ditrans,polycis-polyprenyl diphosphate synthase